MDRLLRLGGNVPGLTQPPMSDAPVVDTAEQVWVVLENNPIFFIQTKIQTIK